MLSEAKHLGLEYENRDSSLRRAPFRMTSQRSHCYSPTILERTSYGIYKTQNVS